jgi:membrane associated rhomboid family serine protease
MPFLPLKDFNPLKVIHFQHITVGLLAVCVAAFLWQLTLDAEAGERLVYSLGMIPAVLLGGEQLRPELVLVPAEVTLITSLFLHGDVLHLGFNMLYLWIFGDNVEDSMGHGRFIVFYLLCGLAASAAHALFNPDSVVPTIGASGAISGVLGAYLILHPRARVLVLVSYFPLRLPAYFVLGLWIAMQLLLGVADSAGAAGVAWWAHIGGFVAGVVLIAGFRYKHVPLFDRARGAGPWGR